MAKTYVIAKVGQFIFGGKLINTLALIQYTSTFETKMGVGQWALAIVPDGVEFDASAADADPDVIIIPESNLDNTLIAPQRNAINNRLGGTDLNVTVASGDTIRDFFVKVGAALGHTEEFILHL
jgi:hypothetical protein